MVPNLSAGITPGPKLVIVVTWKPSCATTRMTAGHTYHIKDWLVQFAEPYWNRLYQATLRAEKFSAMSPLGGGVAGGLILALRPFTWI